MAKQNNKKEEDLSFLYPRDLAFEQRVAGKIATNNENFMLVNQYLTEDCFTDPLYKEIYKAAKDLYNNHKRIDVFNVWEYLEKNNIEYDYTHLVRITKERNTFRLASMAQRLATLRDARKLKNTAIAMEEMLDDSTTNLADVYTRLREIGEQQGVEKVPTTLEEAGKKVIDIMVDNQNDTKKIGTTTGFSKLDEFGGLHKGDLVIVAGDTSNGKTSFALSITLNAILNGKRITYYSLEMSSEELMARILAVRSGVPAARLLYQRTHGEEFDKVYDALLELPKRNLLFDDNATNSFEGILDSIRVMKHDANIDGVVVDYIQILNVNSKKKESQEQLMASVARKLKNLAKELDIWVMALSQLNRNFTEPEPTLSRLRDSGQIAEAADVVILVYRPDLYGKNYTGVFRSFPTKNTAQIEVAKGRNIGLMKFIVNFNDELTFFYEDENLLTKQMAVEEGQAEPSNANLVDNLPF